MKLPEFEALPAPARRRFLKLATAALATPVVAPALRYACNELLMGEAWAQSIERTPPTYFIELGLRHQWDQGHVYVAPGLVRHASLRRGERGRAAAVFYSPEEVRALPNNVFLTADSRALEPHVDSVAMIDTCELNRGAIHGHEAANPLRSPGRDYTARPGTLPMYTNDPASSFPQASEAYYSATPTPASLHNFAQKALTPGLRNGIAFKGLAQNNVAIYHFAAGLPGAELDRVRSRQGLFEAFPDTLRDTNILASPAEADLFARLVGRVDARFLARRRLAAGAPVDHATQLGEARTRLYNEAERRVVSLPLTDAERAYWSADVPAQAAAAESVKAQIWEQMAFAFKLVSNGLVRTVALEFDHPDMHDQRTEAHVRIEAQFVARPLAKLIDSLKRAGIYDRTLIAIYTVDGSRAPAAASYGNEGKNTVILAGGMIRGGYYGDIRVASDEDDGHAFAYHAPDPVTGAPAPVGARDTTGRLPAAAVWRTVMRALRVPDATCARFPDVASAAPLPFLLRA